MFSTEERAKKAKQEFERVCFFIILKTDELLLCQFYSELKKASETVELSRWSVGLTLLPFTFDFLCPLMRLRAGKWLWSVG